MIIIFTLKYKTGTLIGGIMNIILKKSSPPKFDQKCTSEKVPKNLGRALPPSFGQNPKEQQLFFVRPSLMKLISSSPSNTRQAHLHVGS